MTRGKITLFTAIFMAAAFFTSCGEHSLSDIFGDLLGNSSSSYDGSGGGASSGGGTLSSSSCGNSSGVRGQFTDSRDGKVYETVTIGCQTWMARNLNYAIDGKCGNGNSSYSVTDQNTAICDLYGRLYDWAAAMSACPSDWHLPSQDEWNELKAFIESDKGCSGCEAKHLKAVSGWNSNNGLDSYGFAALPGGGGGYVGFEGYWWSSSEHSRNVAYRMDISRSAEQASWNDVNKVGLHSVRCIQGSSSSNTSSNSSSSISPFPWGQFTDNRDGKVYKTTRIDNLTWMAENLNYDGYDGECYNNQNSNCTKYGRLYDFDAATSACPSGWRLPVNNDWVKLIHKADANFTSIDSYASNTAGIYLKATSGWNDYNGQSGNGEDTYGFAALPGGGLNGGFYAIGISGTWWSGSTEYYYSWVIDDSDYVMWTYNNPGDAFHSVRCVKD
jgi:uncharacterized protein (TIGR02145 family)